MTRQVEKEVPNGSMLEVDSPEPTLIRIEKIDPG